MPHAPTLSFGLLILAISVFGFINGSTLSFLLRLRRWYLTGIIGGLLAYGAEEMYSWYRLGYTEAGEFQTVMAYISCGWIMANVMMIGPLLLCAVLSFWKKGRRIFQALGVLAFLGAAAVGMYGISLGAAKEEIHTVDIYIEGLPPEFEGFRIAQLSDTHIGPYYDVDDLDSVLEDSVEQKADFLAITGDLIVDFRFLGYVTCILLARLR